MEKTGKLKNRKGFSLAELLMAVAILLILFGLGVPNLFRMQRTLRQKELDDKAEIIYIAAQSRMTQLRTSGHADAYAADGAASGVLVWEEDRGEVDDDGLPVNTQVQVSYMLWTDLLNGDKAAAAVMTAGSVDDELRSNHWVIEYLPDSGLVYGVYYSERDDKLTDYESRFEQRYKAHLRGPENRSNRMKDGAWIGYYGAASDGSETEELPETSTLTPTITVKNQEKLSVVLICNAPAGVTDLKFHFTMEDSEGHRYEEDFTTTSVHRLERLGKRFSIELTLDDLSEDALRFYNQYGQGSELGDAGLVAGTPLHLTLQVSSENKLIDRSQPVYADTNSLFADTSTEDCAQVKYARHLQNLDQSSHVSEDVTQAVLISDLSFADNAYNDHDWYSYYSSGAFFNGKARTNTSADEANFRPIRNQYLTAFDGAGHTIAALNVDTSVVAGAAGQAGLFETADHIAFTDVTLTGARVNGNTAGALAGAVTGTDVTMDRCRVYLTAKERDGRTDGDIWLSGSTTGGLVGTVAAGAELTVTDSFASTVLHGSANAGGLVGTSAGTVHLGTSYADSYITGGDTGALVGGGTVAEINDCYAAGFQTASRSAAGLVNGEIGTVKRSYTISDMAAVPSPAEGFTVYSTARSVVNAPEQTCYFSGSTLLELDIVGTERIGGMTGQELLAQLDNGSAEDVFTTETNGKTIPYNLRGQTLDTYPYPRLTANKHYGDWLADFQPGALVYFEKYIGTSQEYGFYGANVDSTLTEAGTIVGDGYGVVFKSADLPTQLSVLLGELELTMDLSGRQVRWTESGGERTAALEQHIVTDKNGVQYVILALPVELVNDIHYSMPTEQVGGETQVTGFYQSVTIHSIRQENGVNKEKMEYFYFNPLFAKTVGTRMDASTQVPATPDLDTVAIRSPRHLYDLSLYYDAVRELTLDTTFRQERNISYTSYDWQHFYRAEPDFDADANGGRGEGTDRWALDRGQVPHAASNPSSYVIDAQQPIGEDSSLPFAAVYDGRCYTITDLSFKSVDGMNIGMFGCNTGTVENVVLITEFDPDPDRSHRYFVQREENMGTNDYVYMGVLVGDNEGIIDNCAIAGYYVAGSDGTIHAYDNSKLYVGGLVGENSGAIYNSTADCPAVRVSTVFAEGYVGGFVGRNQSAGVIDNCYALGHLDIAYARGGSVDMGGFAGLNYGTLSRDYCAVSLVASGDVVTTHCFAPPGGSVSSNCYYLDKGTYFYVGELHSYNGNNDASSTSGTSIDYQSLARTRNMKKSDRTHSLCHPNTDESVFPYRAVVKDRQGKYIHYGDWQVAPVLGTLGVFYWEHEVNGANNGYHLTYIGTDEGANVYDTSLCTAHDDHGEIVEYGYGYYVQQGQQNAVKLESTDIAVSNPQQKGSHGTYNTQAKAALEEQMREYVFFPYTTRKADSGDYVYLSGQGREGTWKLTYSGSEGDKSYSYKIAPFFANAIQRVGSSGSINVTASDGRTTNYAQLPGGAGNVYEVRSVQQLQYINWNYDTKDCNSLVYCEMKGTGTGAYGVSGSGNYQKFPYLQYATVLDKNNKQTRPAAEANRPKQYWVQTHDLTGAHFGDGYTPIAGMATSSPTTADDYVNLLFAWFGGSYDGQSYKIQDLNISSPSYTVGVFGATAGADLSSIILYSSDGTHSIKRDTEGQTITISGKRLELYKADGAYFLGGLVGLAYEYDANGANIPDTITNCAIAGYTIHDRSTNRQGHGTANVGGLIGLANVNLERCSAVTDICIDCTHEHGHMSWGSYVRTGGLAGSAGAPNSELIIKDCYTGGKITVSQRTQDEQPALNDKMFAIRDSGNTGYSVNIFASGFISGAYAPNVTNFTQQVSRQPRGRASIENCYTYLQLPDLEGNVRAVSLFANQGDRYGKPQNTDPAKDQSSIINVTNCYYLNSVRESIKHPDREDPSTWPSYFFAVSQSLIGNEDTMAPTEPEMTLMKEHPEDPEAQELFAKFKKLVISEEEFQAMLEGNLSCLNYYLNKHEGGTSTYKYKYSSTFGQATAVDFSNMRAANLSPLLQADRSGDIWSTVTVTEGKYNARIDGKYSFPSTDLLEGKNYPFPTVIRQKDLTYSTTGNTVWANVHYGQWPVDGMYWDVARATMDLFADMDTEPDDDGNYWARKTFLLMEKGLLDGAELEPEDFKLSTEGIVEVESVEFVPVATIDGKEYRNFYEVTLKALKTGALTVTLDYDEELTTNPGFVLEVTGELQVVLPPAVRTFQDEAQEVSLTARSTQTTEKDYSQRGEWSLNVTEEDESSLFTIEQMDPVNQWSITTHAAGTRTLEARFTMDYNGLSYTDTDFLTVKSYGVVGLTDGAGISEAARSRTSKTGDTPDPPYAAGKGPVLPEGATLALYGTVDEGLIASGQRELFVQHGSGEASLVGEDGVTEDGMFHVEVDELVKDGQFEYLPLNLTLTPNCSLSDMGDSFFPLTVTACITDPLDNEVVYTLSVELQRLLLFRVEFDIGFDDPDEQDPMDNVYTYYPDHLSTGGVIVITLPACSYYRTGYTFDGWRKVGEEPPAGQEEPMLYQPGEEAVIETDTVFEAHWKESTYTIHFNANRDDATGEMEDMADVGYAQSVSLTPVGFTCVGKVFTGWNTKADGTGTDYEDEAEVTALTDRDGATVTLYAQWTVITHTVAFDANGGEGEMGTMTFTYGQSQYLLPNAFTRTGYTFTGWRIQGEDEGGVLLADEAEVADLSEEHGATVTLLAQWRPNTYTVVFDPNGGEGEMEPMSFTYDEGQNLTANAFTRDDWDYIGWNTAADGSGDYYTDTQFVENLTDVDGETVTLYAIWSNAALTLNACTGEDVEYRGVDLMGLDSLPNYVQPSEPVATDSYRHEYELMGWYTTANIKTGVKVLNADGTVAADVAGYTANGTFVLAESQTLYALWQDTAYLRENFDPATISDRKWSDTLTDVDFERGDVLEAVLTLNPYKPDGSLVNAQNILSFGEDVENYNNQNTLHIYYPGDKNPNPLKKRFRLFGSPRGGVDVEGTVRIVYHQTDFKFYDVDDDTLLLDMSNNNTANIGKVRNLHSMDVGSRQGDNRFYGTYTYVKFTRNGVYQ